MMYLKGKPICNTLLTTKYKDPIGPQEKTIIPNSEIQEIVADEGYTLTKVIVEQIPSEYVVPSGELEITENGTYDVEVLIKYPDKSVDIITKTIEVL